jgi:hypothetical protein
LRGSLHVLFYCLSDVMRGARDRKQTIRPGQAPMNDEAKLR